MHNQTREPQPYEDCQAKSIQEFGWTSQGMDWGWSRHQEPPHTDVSRNLATVVVFLLLSHSWTTDNVRGVLPGLRRRRTGLLPSGPNESKFCISFGNQGPRVWRKGGEAHSPSSIQYSIIIYSGPHKQIFTK